jgi:hypothetical protein
VSVLKIEVRFYSRIDCPALPMVVEGGDALWVADHGALCQLQADGFQSSGWLNEFNHLSLMRLIPVRLHLA